ncbi:MAG TPA: hypothetical protein VJ872_15800 [Nocardioides sp.]|nr:hypothetical protein [Nocardioides sp.]
MSDPLEQLDRFRSEVEGAPMLTAAEVRRRGDRIRRRGTALRTGAAALAVAAVVVPLGLRGHAFDRDSHVADHTPAGTSVTAQNVLADGDTVGDDGGHWVREYDTAGDGQDAFNPCARQALADLGATSVYRRSWNSSGSQRPAGLDWLGEIVAGFGSTTDATSAADRVGTWLGACTQGPGLYLVGTPTHVDLGGGATGLLYRNDAETTGSSTELVETGVVVSGDRVAVLTWVYHGQDFTVSPSPVEQMMPTAAARLVADGATTGAQPGCGLHCPSPTTTSSTPGTVSYPMTTIPDGFPLDSGWQDDQPEGPNSRLAPSRTRKVPELNACGTTLPWPAYEDRLSAAFHNPEDSRDHVLMTYADADTAVAATKAMVDLFRACPTEPGQPDGYVFHTQVSRTDTSGDSWLISSYYTFNGAPAIGLIDIEVVRVGLGVLVITHGNEGGKESIPMDSKGMETEAADSIAAMCAFTEAGC